MRIPGLRAARFVGLAIASLAMAAAAYANLRVAPMTIELQPSGAGTSESIQVQNITDRPVRLEARVERRFVDGSGQLSSYPDEEKFLVFPPTATVQPGATQSFRIQWVGPPQLAQSESYYVYIKTISDTQFTTSGFALAYQFGVAVHVSPRNAKPAAVLISALAGRTAEGGEAIVLKVRNDGNRFARLSEHDFSLSYLSGGKRFEISRADLSAAFGSGFVLPGVEREFRVPIAQPVDANTAISAKLSLEPGSR
jgi:P pilus assembly chaperone PapD